MQLSDTKSDWAMGPPAGHLGSVHWPTPSNGKHGTVGHSSSLRSTDSSRARRLRMLRSTARRSAAKPEYGSAGVPSTIHEPYSGTQLQPPAEPDREESEVGDGCSLRRSSARISAPRMLQRTVPAVGSAVRMPYSISSPHLSESLLMSLTCEAECDR